MEWFKSLVASAVPFDPLTSGMTSTDANAAILEAFGFDDTKFFFAQSRTQVSTTSAVDVLLLTMSLTPDVAGTYLVLGSARASRGSTGTAVQSYSIYKNAVQSALSEVSASIVSGLSEWKSYDLAAVVSVNGTTDVISTRVRVASGTANTDERWLLAVRLKV